MWFCLRNVLDNVVDLVYFLCSKRRKSLFDFDNLRCANILFQSLSISFLGLFRDFGQFDIFEVFGDLVNLLLQFGGNRGRIFSILAGVSLSVALLLLLGADSIFGVNFAKIFFLKVFEYLSA